MYLKNEIYLILFIGQRKRDDMKNFKGINTEEARLARVKYLEQLGMNTSGFKEKTIDASSVRSNIESYVGTYKIPLGIVGPIRMSKEDGSHEDIMTLAATTEGALVASMSRGASIIKACGGFKAHVQKQRMQRAPIFCFEDLYQARSFSEWLHKKLPELKVFIKQYSKRAELVEIKTNLVGRNVDAKFFYTTSDASGQNMTTICTWHSCLWIENKFNKESSFQILDFVLEGNGASDKKISHQSIQNGRGIDVVVDCVIPEKILNEKLKVSSEQMLKWNNISSAVVSMDGMLGNNVNVANAITALFISTGQDIACVAESCVGFLQLEPHKNGLYFSLNLPKLVIGSVGGGTNLPDSKAVLELMGCHGSDKVERLGQLIAGFALGLEISTMSAMVSGQFAIAHERLGRNKPVNFLKAKELTSDFFVSNGIIESGSSLKMIEEMTESNGIIIDISSRNTEKFIGLSLWDLNLKPAEQGKKLGILKSKATDADTLNCMYMLTGMIDPMLAKEFMLYQDSCEFLNCHTKEIAIYKHLKGKNTQHIPEVFGTYENPDRESYLILMEFLDSKNLEVMNSENNLNLWKDKHLLKSIDALTSLHFDLSDIKENPLFKSITGDDYLRFSEKSIEVLDLEYSYKYQELIDLMKRSVTFVQDNEARILSELPEVLVHNDFNPRNLAITKNDEVLAYDWELATIDIPQRDGIELYAFTGYSKNNKLSFNVYMTEHLKQFNKTFSKSIQENCWVEGYQLSFCKFLLTRLNFYLLGHKLSHYSFIPNLVENVLKLNSEEFKV
jgi:hydroxymethylglutaryl-CoA reductase (NADPH)